MSGFVLSQTVAGAAQFTGLPGAGLFIFTEFDNLPDSARIVATVSYATDVGASGDITLMFVPIAGNASNRFLVGRGLQANITGPAGDADFVVRKCVVPRDAGQRHYQLLATTINKAITGSVNVDFVYEQFPDQIPGYTRVPVVPPP